MRLSFQFDVVTALCLWGLVGFWYKKHFGWRKRLRYVFLSKKRKTGWKLSWGLSNHPVLLLIWKYCWNVSMIHMTFSPTSVDEPVVYLRINFICQHLIQVFFCTSLYCKYGHRVLFVIIKNLFLFLFMFNNTIYLFTVLQWRF